MKFKISQARIDDLEILVEHRLGMFGDMYPDLGKEIENSREQTRKWISERLSNGDLIGFVVRTEAGLVVGSGCLWVKKEQPNPTRLRLEAPYLLSMFTEKNFRRQGVARLIVRNAIAWSKKHGYDRINLHATETGKLIYEELGFKPTSEMQLKL